MKRILFIFCLIALTVNSGFTQESEDLYNEASEHYDNEDYKKSIKLLEKAIAKQDSAKYYFLMASAYRNLGKYEDLYKALSDGLHEFPDDAMLYTERAYFYQQIGKIDMAIRDYKLAIKNAPDDSTANSIRINMATAKSDKRDFEGAYEDYMICYAFDSTNIAVLNNLAMVCDEIGKADESLGYLYRVIELDSTMIAAYSNIGFIHQVNGDYEKSLPFFDKTIELDPEGPFGYSNRSYSRLKLGDLKGALEDINKAIKIYPANSYAYRNRALIYIEMGKMSKACEDIEMALKYGFTEMWGDEVITLQRRHCN